MVNIKDLKSKYIQGIAKEDELVALLEWVRESPENRSELFNEKDIWDAYGFVKDSKAYDVTKELKQFEKRLVPNQKQFTLRLSNYLKIAALFLIAFTFSWLVQSQFFVSKIPVQSAEIRKVEVPKGQINQIFLADGTRIWINSESTLEVPSVFTGDERMVRLSGEAFFEVAKDVEHPFKVMVEGQTVEVLGTSFNIRAYANSSKIQTTLKTGRIKLMTKESYAILSPGEQSELDKISGKLVLKQVNSNNYDSWKEGRYEFINENLIEVFQVMERWYDVEMVYNKEDFIDLKYSGVIRRNKPIEHFLTLLGLSIQIKYEINLDKIRIEIIKSSL